ncbi:hypothetical protein A2661_02170 [Candidatus Giovannonibacteria bacterium RIFCSPHIGHO2_01_FULL_45_24]|uniref:Uncharacterized protein n=1 Tax=Candidatus Giovannonibacteria bacterium RIFCSPLOWO2_01_FULL_46_32 TaxID=1798353 RepID=A0A1F5XHW1_9BACT|nr:MAG: hypothetical protein A2661_02170 [Candidatus Giovannonibacteria bacterium RIFCSPHIGHO2_01_FULL_45_24]OGF87503.1 MAG: hypothetical protein A3B19_02895 [Candidatus Giovannonibacteria bacterium RIFCSPLOWO2_01_FULL_46_32]
MGDLVVVILVLWVSGLGLFTLIGAVLGNQRHGAQAYLGFTAWAAGAILSGVWGAAVWLLTQIEHATEAVANHYAAIVGLATFVVAALSAYYAYHLYLYIFGAP